MQDCTCERFLQRKKRKQRKMKTTVSVRAKTNQ